MKNAKFHFDNSKTVRKNNNVNAHVDRKHGGKYISEGQGFVYIGIYVFFSFSGSENPTVRVRIEKHNAFSSGAALSCVYFAGTYTGTYANSYTLVIFPAVPATRSYPGEKRFAVVKPSGKRLSERDQFMGNSSAYSKRATIFGGGR